MLPLIVPGVTDFCASRVSGCQGQCGFDDVGGFLHLLLTQQRVNKAGGQGCAGGVLSQIGAVQAGGLVILAGEHGFVRFCRGSVVDYVATDSLRVTGAKREERSNQKERQQGARGESANKSMSKHWSRILDRSLSV